MGEARKKILETLAAGGITVEEAEKLLAASPAAETGEAELSIPCLSPSLSSLLTSPGCTEMCGMPGKKFSCTTDEGDSHE